MTIKFQNSVGLRVWGYYGTGKRKLRRWKQIKQQTLIERKKQNQNSYLN